MKIPLKITLKQIIFALLTLPVGSCGGGGGGGGIDQFTNLKGALVEITSEPRTLGVGDRTIVTVYMEKVDNNGALIKIRYPKQVLRYVSGTALLTANKDTVEVRPVLEPSQGQAEGDDNVYILFYFSRDSVSANGHATLELELRAHEIVEQASIEVDSDQHNPDKEPINEFSLANPLFGVEDNIYVRVR